MDDETRQEFGAVQQEFAKLNRKVDAVDRKLDAVIEHLGVGGERKNLDTVRQRRARAGGTGTAAADGAMAAKGGDD